MQTRRKILLVSITVTILSIIYLGPITGGVSKVEANGRMAEITNVLVQIEIGRQALAIAEIYEVEIQFEDSPGAVYRSYNNTMIIDINYSPERAALSFIHEMAHARYYHEGLRPDINLTGRENYISARLGEEAEATALSIEAKTEMAKAGLNVDGIGYPMEKHYHEARTAAEKTAFMGERTIPATELTAIGQEAGLERMLAAFTDGEVWTSRTNKPYPDYYGQCWDQSSNVSPFLNVLGELASNQMANELVSGIEAYVTNYC